MSTWEDLIVVNIAIIDPRNIQSDLIQTEYLLLLLVFFNFLIKK